MSTVLVAPDKFKGSLSASQAAASLALGLRRRLPQLPVITRPVADGGEGTLTALTAAGFGMVPVLAIGADHRPLTASFVRRGDVAVVELAAVAGLSLAQSGVQNPVEATTFGVGQLIRSALDSGCRRIILAVGGSATTDGGIGMMQALGARLISRTPDVRPAELEVCTHDYQLDLTGLDARIKDTEFTLAADVTNPLLGADGAARVFAPQKGADRHDVTVLETRLRRWARAVAEATGTNLVEQPGAGAAGGTGFAALALLGAAFRPGIDLVLEYTGVSALLPGAAFVITGEGSLDAQSLAGKAPIGVARAAQACGVPAIAVAGRVLISPGAARAAGFKHVYNLSRLAADPADAMTHAAELLERVGARIADKYLAHTNAGRTPPTRKETP